MGKMIEIKHLFECNYRILPYRETVYCCDHPDRGPGLLCEGAYKFPEKCPLKDANTTDDLVLKIYNLIHQLRREAGYINHVAVYNAMVRLADDVDKMRDGVIKDAPEAVYGGVTIHAGCGGTVIKGKCLRCKNAAEGKEE